MNILGYLTVLGGICLAVAIARWAAAAADKAEADRTYVQRFLFAMMSVAAGFGLIGVELYYILSNRLEMNAAESFVAAFASVATLIYVAVSARLIGAGPEGS